MGCRGRIRQTAVSGKTRSTRQLEPLASRLKARPEDRRIERVLGEEIHDLAVVGELPPRQHHLVWAFLIELAQPCVSFVRVHVTPLDSDRPVFSFCSQMSRGILEFAYPACPLLDPV